MSKHHELVIAGAIGSCVHVAGVLNFLRLAEKAGYRTLFLGTAVPVEEFIDKVKKYQPVIAGVSYRLTPEVGRRLFSELKHLVAVAGVDGTRFLLGGTPPVVEVAQELRFFERYFNGFEESEEVLAFLRGERLEEFEYSSDGSLMNRMKARQPYPILRHHFGLPSMEETIQGVREIAQAKIVDVISIGPDQNAQASFFRPWEMDPAQDGAGGVPVRKPDDLRALYAAGRTGNYPLMRIYSGTRDLLRWAELSNQTIRNAWAAIPLCWYSTLDGRSDRLLEEAIRENQAAMRWHASRDIPVEVNEAHHWSLRGAHDSLMVAMAVVAAVNAKAQGVRHYIAQYMFNTPPGISPEVDLAKMLAARELIEELHDESFQSYRQVRAGLLSLSPDLQIAKGQLAASTMLALAMEPHIIHVVGFCEGDHAATASDVIESCRIVRGVLRNVLFGLPRMAQDARVLAWKEHFISEARVLIEAIRELGEGGILDPVTSPIVLAQAIRLGLLDAPELAGNPNARGQLRTLLMDGALQVIDSVTGELMYERERIARLELQKVSLSKLNKQANILLKK